MRKRSSRLGISMSLSLLLSVVALTMFLPSAATGLPFQYGSWATKFAQGKPTVVSDAPVPPADAPHGIEGTWRVAGTFDSGNSDQALFTFGAGRDNLGVVTHSDNLFFTAAPSCLPAQGVWKKGPGKNSFVATDEGFCFDTFSNFAPAGRIQFRTVVTVDDHWTTLTGQTHLVAFDPDGNIVFEDDGTLQGTRMAVVGP
jgi:hypothetical protein